MWHAGIDPSWRSAAIAMVDGESRRVAPRSFDCSRPGEIVGFHQPFKGV